VAAVLGGLPPNAKPAVCVPAPAKLPLPVAIGGADVQPVPSYNSVAEDPVNG
jgi:hypothetical protein